MSNESEEFKEYEEPTFDNDAIKNLVNSIFNPALNNILRNQMTFSQYLDNRSLSTTMSSTIWDEFDDYEFNNFNNSFNSSSLFSVFSPIMSSMFDPMEYAERESFEAQSDGLEKTDYNLIIASQKFSSLSDDVCKDKDCSICTVDYEKDDMISITNCNHVFHTDCIKEWAKYKQICPICRAENLGS